MHPTQTNAGIVALTLFARVHALCMLLAAGASLAAGAWLAAAAGALSLCAFAGLQRGRWTPSGRFGAANALTLFRLGLIAALGPLCSAAAPGPAAALLVLAIFTLDGVDGWLARRRGEASTFGAYFDMECDALLVLVCTLVLYQHGRLGAFILLPGVLRYVYLLLVMAAPAPGGETPHTRLERYLFTVLVISLATSLWPLPLHRPFAQLATLLIAFSFARSIFSLFKPA
jgi:phosphatidylglycerophosphate synthase